MKLYAAVLNFRAIAEEFSLPEDFPERVTAEAAAAQDRYADVRTDDRDIPFVTIDPAGSMDLDQAVHVCRDDGEPLSQGQRGPTGAAGNPIGGSGSGADGDTPPPTASAPDSPLGNAAGWRVRYAIADVAAFVEPGSELEAESLRRGQTIYLPDGPVRLHPPELSEGAASLLPGQDRPAVVWDMRVTAQGDVREFSVHRGLVRSVARFDYDEVEAARTAGTLHPSIELLPEVGQARLASPARRDAINLRLPSVTVETATEPAVEPATGPATGPSTEPAAGPATGPSTGPSAECATARANSEGAPGAGVDGRIVEAAANSASSTPSADNAPVSYRLRIDPRQAMNDYNAEISLMTGMCAAELMVRAGMGVVRTLPPASPRDVTAFDTAAAALGFRRSGESIGQLLASVDPSTPQAMALMRDAQALLRGASYAAFGLGGPAAATPVAQGKEHEGPQRPGAGAPSRKPGASGTDTVPIHAGVGGHYAHVTAPLRRLVDRYATEICLSIATGQPIPQWVTDGVDRVLETMATSSRLASQVDRACLDLTEATVLRPWVGHNFQAAILHSSRKRGDDSSGIADVFVADPPVMTRCQGSPPEGTQALVTLVDADPSRRTTMFSWPAD